MRLLASTILGVCHIDSYMHVCSVQDYWESYKLFCYAYYSHSFRHESEFRQSKLGLWFSCVLWHFANVFCFLSECTRYQACSYSYLSYSPLFVLHRKTCMAPTRTPATSLPPCDPNHMHANSSHCGDVLQVGAGGGLHQSQSFHGPF